MKASLLVLAACLALGSIQLAAQAEPAPGEAAGGQSFAFKNFSALDVAGGIRVVLSQDKEFSVVASGDPKALLDLDLRQRGQTLQIGTRPHFGRRGAGELTVAVAMPELARLRLSAASRAELRFDARRSPRLVVELSGGSSLGGLLLASVVNLELTGGSHARLEGYAESAAVQAAGGSRLECLEFAVDTANCNLGGGSYAGLAVQTGLIVRANDGSELEYRGKPDVKQALRGGSRVGPVGK